MLFKNTMSWRDVGMSSIEDSSRLPNNQVIRPIPPGEHSVTPYLTVNNGSNAIDFYKKAFDAEELFRETMPDGKILHARMRIGDSIVRLSDEFSGSPHKSPASLGATTVTLHIYTENVDRLWQQAVQAGAKVIMSLDNQFWGERYGMLVDPFGHQWSMSMVIKMSSEEMTAKRKAVMSIFSKGKHPGQKM
jgi:PhnB protein